MLSVNIQILDLDTGCYSAPLSSSRRSLLPPTSVLSTLHAASLVPLPSTLFLPPRVPHSTHVSSLSYLSLPSSPLTPPPYFTPHLPPPSLSFTPQICDSHRFLLTPTRTHLGSAPTALEGENAVLNTGDRTALTVEPAHREQRDTIEYESEGEEEESEDGEGEEGEERAVMESYTAPASSVITTSAVLSSMHSPLSLTLLHYLPIPVTHSLSHSYPSSLPLHSLLSNPSH